MINVIFLHIDSLETGKYIGNLKSMVITHPPLRISKYTLFIKRVLITENL